MKKIFTLFGILFISSAILSQTFLSEDFSSGQMPPEGWSILSYAQQWSAPASNLAGGTPPEAKFTGFSYNGTIRIFSPSVDLTGVSSVTLVFKHFYDDIPGGGPTIGVATRAGSPWHPVWEITPTNNVGPEEIVVTIENEDVGKSNFQLSFYLIGNMSSLDAWHFDDILLLQPMANDCQMASITTPGTIMNAEPVGGVIKNVGNSTITEVNVSFETFNGIVYDTNLTGLTLELFDNYEFEFDQMWVAPYGTTDMKMWINSVNGGSDDNQGNDTLVKSIEYIPFVTQQIPVLEEFTSSTCGPCANFNASFVPWCQQHDDDIVLVKYQMNWPGSGDPYYTLEGGTRRTYYGVSYVPDLFGNGSRVNTNVSAVQTFYNAASLLESQILIRSSFKITGTSINVTTNILPFADYGSLKVHNVVCENITTGNATSNGETEFHHVMMDMIPDANGATVDLEDRVPVSLNYNVNLSGTNVEEYDDLLVAVMIQNQNTKAMMQGKYALEDYTYSGESRLEMIYIDGEPIEDFDPDTQDYTVLLPYGTTVEPYVEGIPMDDSAMLITQPAFQVPGTAIIEVYAENLIQKSVYSITYEIATGIDQVPAPTVQVFPNPANDQLHISGVKNARVEIFTTDGKVVYSNNSYNGTTIDISTLTRGIYVLRVRTEQANVIRKKIVVL